MCSSLSIKSEEMAVKLKEDKGSVKTSLASSFDSSYAWQGLALNGFEHCTAAG